MKSWIRLPLQVVSLYFRVKQAAGELYTSFEEGRQVNPSPFRYTTWVGILVLTVVTLGVKVSQTEAQPIFINNEAQVPRWDQHDDYRNIYNGRDSAIPAPNGTAAAGPYVTYNNLPGDARVFFDDPRRARYSLNPQGANPTRFMVLDYFDPAHAAGPADLAGGGWHCAPTSTAMWMEWLRMNSLTKLANRGGRVASITGFAAGADTNQETVNPRNGVGLLGTTRPNMISAANDYVRTSYPGILNAIFGPRIGAWNYSPNAYRQMINRNKPPVVFYENLTPQGQPTGTGHVVVGVGYDNGTNEAILADPWRGATRRKGLNNIQQLGGGGRELAMARIILRPLTLMRSGQVHAYKWLIFRTGVTLRALISQTTQQVT